MHTITLSKTGKGWVATHTDPMVRELFGTDTLPTAFTAQAPADKVLAAIRNLNPSAKVQLGKEED